MISARRSSYGSARSPVPLLFGMILTGCGGPTEVESVPTSITISESQLTFSSLADSRQLTATVRDQNGAVLSNAVVIWSSNQPTIAEVSPQGVVQPIADGSATVQASSGEVAATVQVLVAQRLDGILADPERLDLLGPTGDTASIQITYVDPGGASVPLAAASWTLSDAGIVSRDSISASLSRMTALSLGETELVIEAQKGDDIVVDTIPVGVYAPLTFETTALSSGVEGAQYEDSIVVGGGDDPYLWTNTLDSPPAGLSMDEATGRISGVPTSAGPSDFTIRVESRDEQLVETVFRIDVYAVLEITTEQMLDGRVSELYSMSPITAIGGDGEYAFGIVEGSLPDGLVLDESTGEVEGTPTGEGRWEFLAEVASGDGQVASQALSIDVVASLRITTASLSDGLVGDDYLGSVQADAPDGVTVTWSIVSGDLPDGLQLFASTGSLEGVPTTGGTSVFTVQAAGSDGQVDTQELSLTIIEPTVLSPSDNCADFEWYDIASFVDPQLDAAVTMELGDETTCGALAEMTSLSASSWGITDLVGIQNLPNLVTLDLASNDITDLTSTTGLTAIYWLDLTGNASLSQLQPLIDNMALGSGDTVLLTGTSADCTQVAALTSRGVSVVSDCP